MCAGRRRLARRGNQDRRTGNSDSLHALDDQFTRTFRCVADRCRIGSGQVLTRKPRGRGLAMWGCCPQFLSIVQPVDLDLDLQAAISAYEPQARRAPYLTRVAPESRRLQSRRWCSDTRCSGKICRVPHSTTRYPETRVSFHGLARNIGFGCIRYDRLGGEVILLLPSRIAASAFSSSSLSFRSIFVPRLVLRTRAPYDTPRGPHRTCRSSEDVRGHAPLSSQSTVASPYFGTYRSRCFFLG